jgi:Domain of unknown function (DUF1963)
MSRHPVVDLDYWIGVFPIEKLRDEHEAEYAQYPPWKGKPREELRRLTCDVISTPCDLAKLEQLREPVIVENQIDEAVPVDLFLWRQAATPERWLTRIGGTPYQPSGSTWPKDPVSGRPYTFVAQISFVDSLDVLPVTPPGELLLVFFKDAEAIFDVEDSIRFEWVRIDDCDPISPKECPEPSFTTPELTGVRYRGFEFPDHSDAFEEVDCGASYLLPVSQATKIGTESHFIQGYPDVPDGSVLIATLSSLQLHGSRPLIDEEVLPTHDRSLDKSDDYGWGKFEMMLGDVGCLYIFLDESGNTLWRFDCY